MMGPPWGKTEVPDTDNDILLAEPVAKPLGDLQRPEIEDPEELLENRFLCRGGGLLLVGPTGIGKSALSMQMMIKWSIAQPVFEIVPSRPLKSLLIQAENDDGDLAEMRDGVATGLDLSREEMDYAYDNIVVVHEDCRTGADFSGYVLQPLLKQHKPDLVWIDPALAFLGGDTNSQKDVGIFLRNNLNPVLRQFNCAAVVVHHTNKPPTGQEKSRWQAGDFAYLGSGSAEWSNWPRAVIALRSTGSHSVYELIAGKRGRRLRWTDADGTPVYSKFIAHAKESGVICWRDADPEEIPRGAGPEEDPKQTILSYVPADGSVSKNSVISRVNLTGVGKNRVRDIISDLIGEGILHEWEFPRKGNRPEVHLARSPQPPQQSS